MWGIWIQILGNLIISLDADPDPYQKSRAGDPDLHGFAFNFPLGSGSAFNMRIRIQEGKLLRTATLLSGLKVNLSSSIFYVFYNLRKLVKVCFLQIWLSWTWTWIRIRIRIHVQKNCWVRMKWMRIHSPAKKDGSGIRIHFEWCGSGSN